MPIADRTRWIALFRGINVGGNNKLPMGELRALAGGLGFENCRTYIQSGNLLLDASLADAAAIETKLAAAVERAFGFRPAILMRTIDEFAKVAQANPFATDVSEGKQLHIYFCDGDFDRYDEIAIVQLLNSTEKIAVIDGAVYLFAPEGVGRSKLAETLPRFLPKRHSARNLNTVLALLQLASDSKGADT